MAKKKEKVKVGAVVDGVEKKVSLVTSQSTIDRASGRQIIDLTKVEPLVKDKVLSLTRSIMKSMTDVRIGYMKIGKDLTEAEDLLKKRGLFVFFLNSFPNFKQAQAYRYINAYKLAEKNYTPAILDAILSTGMPMIGTKDRPFGKYQDIVKQLPPPQGDNLQKAVDWLNTVGRQYSESRKKESKSEDNLSLQKECFLFIKKRYDKIPDTKRLRWTRDLFGYFIGTVMGMKQDETIQPKDAPAGFLKTVSKNDDSVAETEESE